MRDPNNPAMTIGKSICGYRLQKTAYIDTNQSWFYLLEHELTGARHVHLSRMDSENTFAVAFQTVPLDSSGVAHILEHTVLCGSKRYPVRDPFFSMLRRSLSTFMNAFTASDWTMYPFATQNPKDYYNLMDVYLNAVFFPRLDDLSFKQEGHRLEIETAAGGKGVRDRQLVRKGVVYNEMKGAMSSPDQVMVRSILKALYPDTTYSNNSGGDPAVIPSLTHDQLVTFHRKHYHPSNAYFYTYGNLPLKDHLGRIGEQTLVHFQRIDRSAAVPPQPRWSKPKTAGYSYPVDPAEDISRKYQMCLAWLTADIRDHFEVLKLVLLEQILLGNAASPMRKTLMESGLGSALCDGCGFDAENRDTLFVFGLKDVSADAMGAIETLVQDQLRVLCESGIDKRLIESALHQIEFHRKEITNTPYPYGLKQLMSFAGPWFHGTDPLKLLHLDEDLSRLRGMLEREPLFEDCIRRYFLENPHQVKLTLTPDQTLARAEEKRVREELGELLQKLSGDDLQRLERDAESLRRLQEEEEDISCLPTLEREDIPPTVFTIHASETDSQLPLTYFDQGTSGIAYLSAAAGTGTLATDLIPLVRFFSHAFSRIGIRGSSYAEMARRIDESTGGLGLATHARTRFDARGRCVPFLSLNSKCLDRNLADMFQIVRDLVNAHDFGDLDRLKTLLYEYRAALESAVIHNGHRLAISLAARNFSTARALNEIWGGVGQLVHIKQLADDAAEAKLAALGDRLSTIGRHLFSLRNTQMALIGETRAIESARPLMAALAGDLPAAERAGFDAPGIRAGGDAVREGWVTSTAVSFVAQAFQTVRMAHKDSGALAVVAKLLRSMVLHREIREKGGAYGGFALYNPEDGIFCMASYRDPHIVRTESIYRDAAESLLQQRFSDEDVKEAILQVCSEIDKPDPPGPAARKAFYRAIVSLSDELRADFKSRLLGLRRQQVLQAVEDYFRNPDIPRSLAVISNEEKLNEANSRIEGKPLKIRRI
jgi:Zn-dependent M16 (insulinase) family peptidase